MLFCQPPVRDQLIGGGAGSFPEQVKGCVSTSVCGLSLAEPAVGMAEAKRQQLAAFLNGRPTVTDICHTLGMSERLIFKVKKLLKEGKDLKIVHRRPKGQKWIVAAIGCVATGIRRETKKSIWKLLPNIKWTLV